MSSEIAIKVETLSKRYQIYDTPRDRLKQFVMPRLQRLAGRSPRQYFREFWALNDVSFEVKKGETVGIIGCNGSGKSTLLQIICGTLTPTSGVVATNGRIAALLELGSGFNPEFTGRENVYMNGAVWGLGKEKIDACYDSIVAFADIGDFIEQPVKTYSSGMVVRLAFAVAVAVQPDILVVDEALAVGDEPFQRKCFARIEEIKKAGGTILFVTHATQTVIELCDRAILLRRGEMVYFGDSHRTVNLYYKIIGKSDDKSLESIAKESALLGLRNDEKDEPSTFSELVTHRVEEGHGGGLFLYQSEVEPELDASLVSQTSYETHEKKYGVSISNISLQSVVGARVNILESNERYLVSFDVEFTRPARNISYQILFKTVNGVPVAGDKFFHDATFPKPISANSKLRIRYEFRCLMTPGVYFISIEVCGSDGDHHVVYHKFAEVLAYRVLAKGKSTAIGYASVMPSIEMKVL